jgi:GNAT superfamily N-acetyltransferase
MADVILRPMADVILRAPRAGDGDGLARSWLDAGADYVTLNPDLFQIPQADGLAQRLDEWLLNIASEDAHALVAEKDEQVVGFITAAVERPVENAAGQLLRDLGRVRVVIHALVVQEAHRWQGIGTRLMEAAEEWIVLLDTYVGSPLSVPFYEQRMGYSRRALRFRKTLV